MGYNKHVLIVPADSSDGGYSEAIDVDNAIEISGTPEAGQVPVVQADGAVMWMTLS